MFPDSKRKYGNMITKAQFEYRRKIQKSEWHRRKQA